MVSYCALTDLTKLFWHSKNAKRQVTIARHPVIENGHILAHWNHHDNACQMAVFLHLYQ